MQPAWLRNLRVTKVALCGRGMNPEAEIALYKSAEVPTPTKEAEVADNTTDEVVEETVAKADYDAIVAELDALKNAVEEPTSIDKSELPEAVVKALEEADELRARVEKMEQERRAETFARKAADEFGHIAPAAELAPVLEVLDRVAPEQAKVLDQCLKAANARIAEGGIFTEIGSDADQGDDTVAKAEALIAKAVEGGLSRADAIRKVFSENPELVTPARAAQ